MFHVLLHGLFSPDSFIYLPLFYSVSLCFLVFSMTLSWVAHLFMSCCIFVYCSLLSFRLLSFLHILSHIFSHCLAAICIFLLHVFVKSFVLRCCEALLQLNTQSVLFWRYFQTLTLALTNWSYNQRHARNNKSMGPVFFSDFGVIPARPSILHINFLLI